MTGKGRYKKTRTIIVHKQRFADIILLRFADIYVKNQNVTERLKQGHHCP